jgi:hypothetical protein
VTDAVFGAVRRLLSSPTRGPRIAVVLGRLLGLAFVVCFATGLFSHLLQDPLPGMRFPTDPPWIYQATQGIHVTAGIACFPLILGKLYAVYPRLFDSPPVRSFPHLLERASIALFVAASLVEITIGLVNTFQWYPWPFPFRQVHFALAFVVIGSLAVHIGVKLPVIARYWTRDRADRAEREEAAAESPAYAGGITGRVQRAIDGLPHESGSPADGRIARRGFLAAIGLSALAVVVLTAGQSARILDPVNLFAPRKAGVGPNALPVNRTAAAAQVEAAAVGPDWRLEVAGGTRPLSLSRGDLLALDQSAAELPIACVEGWSQQAQWTGVPIRALARMAGIPAGTALRITSLEKEGGYRVMEMGPEYADDERTLVALTVNGETLDLDHGYPARIIAPGRPGVLQTKWLQRIEAL